jgi:hypothetical protein
MSGIDVKLKYNDAEYTGEINQIKQEGGQTIQVGGDEALNNALVNRATAETTLHITYYKLMLFNEQIDLLNKLKDFYNNNSISPPEDLENNFVGLQQTISQVNTEEVEQREDLKQKNKEALTQLDRDDATDKEEAALNAAKAAKDLLETFKTDFDSFIDKTTKDMQTLLKSADAGAKADIEKYQSNVAKMNDQVKELFRQLQERKGEAQTAVDTNKEAGKIIWNIKSGDTNLVNAMKHDLSETFNPLHYDKEGINAQTDELDAATITTPANASEPGTAGKDTINNDVVDKSKSFYQKAISAINKFKPVKTVTLDTGYGVQGNNDNTPPVTGLTTNKKSATTLNVTVKMKDKDGKPKGTYSGKLTRKTTFADQASNVTRTVKNVVPFIQQTLGLDINSRKTQILKIMNNNNPTLDDLNTMVKNIENIKNKEPNDTELTGLIEKAIEILDGLIKDKNNNLNKTYLGTLSFKLQLQQTKANDTTGGKTRNKRMRPRRHTTYKYKSKPKPKPKPNPNSK